MSTSNGKTAHTPGPWSVNRHGAIVGGTVYEYTNGSGQAQLAFACLSEGVDAETQAANARLIAAAPSLYEALTELIAFAEPILKNHGFGYMGKFEKARTALKLAMGDEG